MYSRSIKISKIDVKFIITIKVNYYEAQRVLERI